MDQPSLESALADLPLPLVRYFPSLDSTNAEAWRWLEAGAPHAALVIADEQTAGRGRYNRKWVTVAGSSLAFSLVLLSPPLKPQHIQRLVGLGALAVCQVLKNSFALPALIKWPNDILLNQRKVGGILVETRWQGDQFRAAVIGIGINIAPQSISPLNLPAQALNYPATCLEQELNRPVQRLDVLHGILTQLFMWFVHLSSPEFIKSWEANLAYLNQWVELSVLTSSPTTQSQVATFPDLVAKIIGLDQNGSLKLLSRSGTYYTLQESELRLKPFTPPS